MSKTNFNFGSSAQMKGLPGVMASVHDMVNSTGRVFQSNLASRMLSLESLDAPTRMEINTSLDQLQASINTLAMNLANEGYELNSDQKRAGMFAGVCAADPKAFIHRQLAVPAAGPNTSVVTMTEENCDRVPEWMAIEAYDETATRSTTLYSITYNLLSSRQDEFGEGFYRTVTLAPDQAGVTYTHQIVEVFDEIRRKTDGKTPDNFGRKNILRARRDATILRNDTTLVIPIVRDESAEYFVDPALVAPYGRVHEGETFITAPLAFGADPDLLGISQSEALLQTGIQDQGDALDSSVRLQAVYMTVGTGSGKEVLKFSSVNSMPGNVFTPAMTENYRRMDLNFSTTNLPVNKHTLQSNGSASVLLKALVDGEYDVKLKTAVYGQINLEYARATCGLNAAPVSVYSVVDKDGRQLDLKTGAGKVIADLFAGAEMFGYDLEARRTNSNRRVRGQLLNINYFNTVFILPLLAPISIVRPANTTDANDTSDMQWLIAATNARTSNAAVTALLRAEETLREWVGTNGRATHIDPQILGVGRNYISAPWYEYREVDVRKVLQMFTSSDKIDNIREAIVTILRDMTWRAYKDTEYRAASDGLSGNMASVPMVMVGTDQYIARYIFTPGDTRSLGNQFQMQVVETLDSRMDEKIVFTFRSSLPAREGEIDILSWGNMLWRPELVTSINMPRNGSYSKELTVQPSFLHVNNCPILGSIKLQGLMEVINERVPFATQEIPLVP